MTPTVPTDPAASEPDYFAEIADELLRIAEDLRRIGPGAPKPYFSVAIQPGTDIRGDDDAIIAAVDAVSLALTGKPGATVLMSDGISRHHKSPDFFKRGPVYVSAYQAISTKAEADAVEAQRAKDSELERLRAEVAELRGDKTGLKFSREADDPTPGDVPSGVEGGSVTGRASVPVLCAAVLADGVACGARIYWNVAANAWWHLWRQGEGADVLKHTATGPSVPPEPDSAPHPGEKWWWPTECDTCGGDTAPWSPDQPGSAMTHIVRGGGPDWETNRDHDPTFRA